MRYKQDSKHVIVNGIEFSVDFKYAIEKDPCGIGDGKKYVELTDLDIEHNGCKFNDLLNDAIIEQIEQDLINYVLESEV